MAFNIEDVRRTHDGEVHDISDSVACFENGKTFECPCGQPFGTEFHVRAERCPSCGAMVVDTDAADREASDGNHSIDDFL